MALTVVTYSEGFVTGPYALPVKLFGSIIETFGTVVLN
jgi:hypothetical protein